MREAQIKVSKEELERRWNEILQLRGLISDIQGSIGMNSDEILQENQRLRNLISNRDQQITEIKQLFDNY